MTPTYHHPDPPAKKVNKGPRLGFNTFEIGCLVLSGTILVVWRLTHRSIEANYALQAVMAIAYAPLIFQLLTTEKNTESFATWSVWLAAAISSLTAAILDRNRLGIVYSSRGVILVSVVLALMLRLELRGP